MYQGENNALMTLMKHQGPIMLDELLVCVKCTNDLKKES